MRRPVLLLSLLLAACSSHSAPDERDHDVEIAQAAQIGDPIASGSVWYGSTGEDINLTPSGGFGFDFGENPLAPFYGDGGTMRLSNFVAPGRILGDTGVDIRGLGTETGEIANLNDVTNGLEWNAVRRRESGRSTWKSSPLVPNLTRLMVGEEEELPLERMAVRVRVAGHRARVVLDLSYVNDRDRQLEGMFQLRLPAGATPFWLAFGEEEWRANEPLTPVPAGSVASIREAVRASPTPLREARMTIREKAGRAYGETVRRRVDPALLEWSGSGVFSARVFPLLPDRRHRIVVGYDLDLVRTDDGFSLPLELPEDVEDGTVTLTVDGGAEFTVNREPTGERSGELVFAGAGFGSMEVRIPSAEPVLLADDAHFGVSVRPDIPADPVAGSPHAIFLVDVSLSSNPDRFRIWRELLPAILDANRADVRDFAVLFFNIETFWWQPRLVPNTPENVRGLLAFFDRLSLEGATDLGAALRAVGGAPFVPDDADLFLLSDAATTWGAELPTDPPGPIFSYGTGTAGTDVATLAWLARATGGAVFSVTGESGIPAAAVAHRSRPFAIRSVSVAGGRDLLLAGRPVSLHPGQTLTVAGRGRPEPGAALDLVLARDGVERTVRLPLTRVIETPLATRVYGEIATRQLEGIGEAGHEPASAYASHFRVVGRTCSLLMLETEEDYREFEIEERDDAAFVESEPAEPIVRSAIDEARAPRTRKAKLVAWLRRLKGVPGVDLALSEDVWRLLEGLPDEAFRFAPAPISCRQRARNGLPAGFLERLAARSNSGEDFEAEAARRREECGPDDALRALSSIVEESPGDAAVLRDVAYSAMADRRFEPALHLLRRVAHARPWEPETWRALARCHEAAGKPDLALLYYEVALAGKWVDRFGEFRRIVALDYLRLLREIGSDRIESLSPRWAAERRAALSEEYDFGTPGLVVVLTWNTDRSDMDLHVTDPNGEKCWYQHKATEMGGRLSTDVTRGYGPEMFLLPDPAPGTYSIAVQSYSGNPNRMSLRTRVFVTIYEDWGTAEERVTRRVATLEGVKEMEGIAKVVVTGGGKRAR